MPVTYIRTLFKNIYILFDMVNVSDSCRNHVLQTSVVTNIKKPSIFRTYVVGGKLGKYKNGIGQFSLKATIIYRNRTTILSGTR